MEDLKAFDAEGDLKAARIANEAISKLLGTSGDAADVIDLAKERRRSNRA